MPLRDCKANEAHVPINQPTDTNEGASSTGTRGVDGAAAETSRAGGRVGGRVGADAGASTEVDGFGLCAAFPMTRRERRRRSVRRARKRSHLGSFVPASWVTLTTLVLVSRNEVRTSYAPSLRSTPAPPQHTATSGL